MLMVLKILHRLLVVTIPDYSLSPEGKSMDYRLHQSRLSMTLLKMKRKSAS